ncbi:MAG TPA: hypothetical protein VF522_00785 [Ramlibacter sp.]|uniref:DUF6933 domain-containing protein n=1 Tax=Ramlibacter sp. TaxID=1917967 RepID=UPI002ED6980B
MLTLRCTQKLLARGLESTAGAEEPPTALLGDWYANVLSRRPQHLVLCISERTLLPVILPAKDAKSLPKRLSEAVCLLLDRLGIEPGEIERERREMCAVRVGRTVSRGVLGSLNDLMFHLRVGLDMNPETSLVEQAHWLAETPCKPIEYASPAKATQALFASSVVLAKVGSGAP